MRPLTSLAVSVLALASVASASPAIVGRAAAEPADRPVHSTDRETLDEAGERHPYRLSGLNTG